MTMPSPSRRIARPLGTWLGGPPAAFAASVLAAFAALATCRLTLPRDLAFPLVSAFLFVLAALVALAGWSRRPATAHAAGTYGAGTCGAVTYRDVAGALTFIGIFVAALVDPDQMVRIVAGTYREE